MSAENERSDDPHVHIANVKSRLGETIDHLRQDVSRVHEPKAQALFETTAEVLQGLVTAFEHYEEHAPAWR